MDKSPENGPRLVDFKSELESKPAPAELEDFMKGLIGYSEAYSDKTRFISDAETELVFRSGEYGLTSVVKDLEENTVRFRNETAGLFIRVPLGNSEATEVSRGGGLKSRQSTKKFHLVEAERILAHSEAIPWTPTE